jgi:hypothetical protein
MSARDALIALENLSGDIFFDEIDGDKVHAITKEAAKHLRALLDAPAEPLLLAATLKHLKERIDYRMNDYLCEMKEGYDDSITGFNEAWDVVREIFVEARDALKQNTDEPR